MGQLLKEDPQNQELLGAGSRASTLRSRVRGVQKKFLGWLAAARGLFISRQLASLFRISTGTTGGTLCSRCVEAYTLVLHIPSRSCRRQPQTHRRSALCGHQNRDHGLGTLGIRRCFWLHWKILSRTWKRDCTGKCWPGGCECKPGGRSGLTTIGAFSRQTVVVEDGGMQTKLTRSKVSGPDKKVVFRIVVVDSGAFVQHRDWLVIGWKVLCEADPCERDYLMPAPTNNYKGCRYAELQYHTAFAIQSRIIAHAAYRGQRTFNSSTPHYKTPHSGRNSKPSAAANQAAGHQRAAKGALEGQNIVLQ